jgi:hypothetical protein
LTAGFLPGDLSSIIRKASGMFLGQLSTPSLKEKEVLSRRSILSVEKEVFSWRSMLSVISSLPPKQLQKLDSLVTG